MSSRDADRPNFDAYAAAYDQNLEKGLAVSGESKDFFAGGRVAWLAQVLEKLGSPCNTIMDYGCGTGSSTPYLFDVLKAAALTGIDVSEDSLAIARRTYPTLPATFLQPGHYTPAANLDLAFCNGVFHHIPPAERAGAVGFVHQSLRPGGLFSFWENNPWNPGTRWVISRIPFDRDAITLTPPEARLLLKNAGFEILRTDFLFVFPRILSWMRRFEPWLIPYPLGAQYHILCRK